MSFLRWLFDKQGYDDRVEIFSRVADTDEAQRLAVETIEWDIESVENLVEKELEDDQA
jgi:hypothetical protein